MKKCDHSAPIVFGRCGWSAAIILFGGFNVVAYTTDHWLLIPAVLGAFVGTWYAVWKAK